MSENDDMVTMHDVMDAQWMYDNTRDGEFRCLDPPVTHRSFEPQNPICDALYSSPNPSILSSSSAPAYLLCSTTTEMGMCLGMRQ